MLTLDNGDTITNPYEHAKIQIVYLVEYYFLEKMKFWNNYQIYLTSLSWLVIFLLLKTAKVVPAFKKDSKLDYSSYRPITLLSNIEKMLEEHMHKRLYTFFNNNNIIYIWFTHYGFRQQYSTFHALINIYITENIRKALDDGNIGCRVFVDYTKSFWYCRSSDTDSTIESLWDSMSFKSLV